MSLDNIPPGTKVHYYQVGVYQRQTRSFNDLIAVVHVASTRAEAEQWLAKNPTDPRGMLRVSSQHAVKLRNGDWHKVNATKVPQIVATHLFETLLGKEDHA